MAVPFPRRSTVQSVWNPNLSSEEKEEKKKKGLMCFLFLPENIHCTSMYSLEAPRRF